MWEKEEYKNPSCFFFLLSLFSVFFLPYFLSFLCLFHPLLVSFPPYCHFCLSILDAILHSTPPSFLSIFHVPSLKRHFLLSSVSCCFYIFCQSLVFHFPCHSWLLSTVSSFLVSIFLSLCPPLFHFILDSPSTSTSSTCSFFPAF